MLDKKKDKDQKTSEQEALEKQIDAMMDPKRPDGAPEPAAAAKADPIEPPDLSSPSADGGSRTAPELPDKLRKQLGVDAKPTKPITIKKLDEITERIAETPPVADKPKKKEPEKTSKDEKPAKTEAQDGMPDSDDAEKSGRSDEDISKQSTDLDDVRTDAAVDDIVSYEGDVMLAIADSTAAERNRQAEAAAGTERKKGNFSAFLWFLVFVIAVIALLLLGLLVTGGNVHSIKL